MRRRPPHILVTTPESLYVLLGSESGRKMLATTRSVIVDEIHAVAPNKRGSHLSLSLERLAALCEDGLLRIGLSATQTPINSVAHFLVGAHKNAEATIIDTGHQRPRDLGVEVPNSPLEAVMSGEVWQEVYDRLAALIEAHRTTLVFVNTRRMAERVARAIVGTARRRCGNGASRQHGEGKAPLGRAEAQEWPVAGVGRHRVAGARHRYRRRGSGVPARLAALGRGFPATGRTLRPRHRRHAEGAIVSAVARRSGRMRRFARQRAAGRTRPPDDPGPAAGRARPADRGRSFGAGLAGRRALRIVFARLAIPGAVARKIRRGGAHARRGFCDPPWPARRADPPRRGQQNVARPAGRAHHRLDLRRHDTRHRRLSGGAGAGKRGHRLGQ